MSDAYEEVIRGRIAWRPGPDGEHELLLGRLHALVQAALPPNSALILLPARSPLALADDCVLHPDLALVRRETADAPAAPYLVAEVLQPGDHHLDTVVKKDLWSALRLPRLWMIDPRYNNVEVYGRGPYGFTLLDILANHHPLTDPCLPGFSCPMHDLFRSEGGRR